MFSPQLSTSISIQEIHGCRYGPHSGSPRLFPYVSGIWTHCHLEGGQLLGVDDSLVNGVGLRQVDHFAERGGDKKHYEAVKDEITILVYIHDRPKDQS